MAVGLIASQDITEEEEQKMKSKNWIKKQLLGLSLALITSAAAIGDAYQDLVAYDWDKARTPLTAIEEEIRQADSPEALGLIEVKLVRVLEKTKTTYAGKQFICRKLRQIGTERSAPALGKLLQDEKLAHMARFALQHMPDAAATEALLSQLNKVSGKLQIGVVTSLGDRGDKQASSALAKLAANPDPAMAKASIIALGKIADRHAFQDLLRLRTPESLKPTLVDARLRCADKVLALGGLDIANTLYREVMSSDNTWTQIAALRGLAQAAPKQAAKLLIEYLQKEDPDLQAASRRFIMELPGEEATQAIAAQLSKTPAHLQIVLLDLLAARKDSAAAAQVTRLLNADDEDVRLATIQALGNVGDVSTVPLLAKIASAGDKAGDAAIASLNSLRGDGIGIAMSNLLNSPDPAIKAGILGVLASRADKTTAPAMLKAAQDSDERIRKMAVKGLTAVGGEEELPGIVALLLSAQDDEKSQLAGALNSALARAPKQDSVAGIIALGLRKADLNSRVYLINSLSRIGGALALNAVREQLRTDQENIVDATVRALAAWPDPAPAEDLLKIITRSDNRIHKVLAYRAYLRMAGISDATAAMNMYKQAFRLAKDITAKKSLLSGLALARDPEALTMVKTLMAEENLRAEAELAYVRVAENLRDSEPSIARKALNNIIENSATATIRDRAQAILNEMDKYRGYITSWSVAGPYTNGDPFKTTFPPEQRGASRLNWSPLNKGVGPQVINLLQTFSGNNRAAYLRTYVFSPAATKVRLEIGSDDGNKVWINQTLVHANNATRPLRPGQDKAEAQLRQGWNHVLAKISQGGGDWAFSLRIVKADGSVIDGLKVSLDEMK
jgi:HEAT repeat protein